MEQSGHKPRNVWSHPELEEAGKDPPLEQREQARPTP